ncbi:MAG: hydrolase family protein [Caulobacteraceae bacterium]|nr:hydrolase family protein [Caulobacteraceae bacterium]
MTLPSPRPRLLVGLAALLLCACATLPGTGLKPGARYVAMGSSFAAGAGLPAAPGGLSGCGQSAVSYAHQLAALRGLNLVDASCGGATTANMLTDPQLGHPPQIEALTADTALVTVTGGGNDVGYIADLTAWGCRDSAATPAAAASCAAPSPVDRAAEFAALPGRMDRIVAEVRRRSPKAKLVFVDYVTLAPEAGKECPGLGLNADHALQARDMAAQLATITAQAAKRAHAVLVTASTLSRDHAICSAQPWANGAIIAPADRADGSAVFHPRRAGMNALTQAVDKALGR